MPARSLKGSALAVMIVVATLGLGRYAAGQQTAPATPAGQKLALLIQAVNSGDRGLIRAFIQDNYGREFLAVAPLDEHVNILTQVYDGSRGVDLKKLERSSELSLAAVVQEKLSGGWEEWLIDVEQAPPHKIASLGFRPSPAPADLAPAKKITAAEAVAELAKSMDKLVAADLFSGTVLLAKDGHPLYAKACGLASKSFDVPNRLDTKFNLGSMNKMFTAVAGAQLVERGMLSYDDPVGTYLGPDWVTPETAKKVKVCHLLSHTSGLGSYFNEKFQQSSRLLFRNVDDFKTLAADDKPVFEPGTKWQYSNTGFLLLGAIIEKVTGRSYFDYVRENIFQPAGMINTDSYEMDRPTPNLAVGYEKVFGPDGKPGFRNNIFDHVVKGGPAGGGFSTVEDLLRFDIALRSNNLLKKETRELLMSAKPELKSPEYGYGFGLSEDPQLGRIVGHSGGFTGINSSLDMYLDSGFTVIVMSNYSNGAQPVAQKIRDLLRSII